MLFTAVMTAISAGSILQPTKRKLGAALLLLCAPERVGFAHDSGV
jgi:hypothetical protein